MKEIEIGFGYKLKRLDANNWQLWQYREPDMSNGRAKSNEPKWMPCGKYYQQLNQALRAVYEMVLREGDGCADLKAAIDRAEKIASTINANAHLLRLGGK